MRLLHIDSSILGADVTFVRAEGLGLSPEHREKGLNAAVAAIKQPVAAAA